MSEDYAASLMDGCLNTMMMDEYREILSWFDGDIKGQWK